MEILHQDTVDIATKYKEHIYAGIQQFLPTTFSENLFLFTLNSLMFTKI